MKRGRIVAIALGIAVIAVAAWRLLSGPATAPQAQAGPVPVTVAHPLVRTIVEQDEFTGRFEAARYVELRARVTGYLSSVPFPEGAIVAANDLVAVIDQRPLQASVNQAQANVASLQTRLDFYRADLERTERLARSGVTPERTLDERRQLFLQAQADINAARAALEQARLSLGFAEIRAPVAGRIGRRLVTAGNLAVADQTLLTTIVSLNPIHFYFDVDERSYLAYMRMAHADPAAPARGITHPVQVALSDERIPARPGRLDFVDNRVDAATGTVRMRAVVDNDDLAIAPGLFGRVQLAGSPPYDAVLIPDEAIAADQDRRFVYVVAADGTIAQRTIRPGPREHGYRVVRQGLAGTDTIVVSGLLRLRPGVRVHGQMTTLPPERP